MLGNQIQYCLLYRGTPGESDAKACWVQISSSLLLSMRRESFSKCTFLTTYSYQYFQSFKCVPIVWIIAYRENKTLCTLGDAIASFLQYSDPMTHTLAILTKADY